MTGLFVLFITVAWAGIAVWLSRIATSKLSATNWRMPAAVAVFAALLPLPVIDEVVGGRQFKQLCKENSTIQLDRAKVAGKTVYYTPQPSVEIGGTWVRIALQPHLFVDAKSGEQVIGYNTLIADGGWFIKALRISEGGVPLTFRGSCAPSESIKELFRELGVVPLDRQQPISRAPG